MNRMDHSEAVSAPGLRVDFTCLPVINFALQQNHVPLIRQFIIKNDSAQDYTNLVIEITSEPEFTVVWRQTLDVLRQGESNEIRNAPVKVLAQYLAGLTEKLSGNLVLSITADHAPAYREYFPISLLAYDQWNGSALLPEMLSAFITPNHPEIPAILRKAAEILQQWTGSPSFDEYQSRNPDRVRKQMAAIYEAIAAQGFIYCSVPASFEEQGQRIRLADAIFKDRLANCLDLSLLYAACLEAVGIHPFIIIVKGHAFAGGWLIDESFADAVNDDPSLINKRTADGINEIVVVEATCMNAGHYIPFDEAVRSADQKMQRTDDFHLFIDIKRSRFSGIRPLPLRIQTSEGWTTAAENESTTTRAHVLPGDISVGPKLVYTDKTELTKQRLWERKLLDLTLRNSLLNVRVTRSVIQFMTTDVASLEDALADGAEFQVLARPSDWDNTLRDAGLYTAIHQSDPMADLVKQELSHKRIRTYLSENDLGGNLTNIYRSSRLSLEENGANTLYIGLGLLKWFETDLSERPRFAPVLLVPVEIIRRSVQKGFVIRSREEETIMNVTLLEMIRQDFGISIGGLETLPKDESGVDVKLIFNTIRQAIMSKSRWDVEEQAILGTFSFSKFILWNDIHHNAEKLRQNKVVASLMSGKLEWETPEDTSLADITDDRLHPADIALPISTDSSQLHAILNSGRGKSFVLHGPPGTGKSQTITNIIANALYAGKKVLFVAAKKAALEVVESRLKSIGLAPFCLELHSNKSKKSAVLEQLKASTEIGKWVQPENFSAEAGRLQELRHELNAYVEALHTRQPFGLSLYDLFSRYSQQPLSQDKVSFPAASVQALTESRLVLWQDLAEEMHAIGSIIGNPGMHPLKSLEPASYTSGLKQEATELLQQLATLMKATAQEEAIITRLLHLEHQPLSSDQEPALIQLIRLLTALDDIPGSLLQADALEQTLTQVSDIADHGIRRDLLRSELYSGLHKESLTYPATQTLTAWNTAAGKWFLPRWFKQNALLKSLKPLSKSGSLNKEEVPDLLRKIISCQEEQDTIDKASYLPGLLGFLWNNGDCDWNRLKQLCSSLTGINKAAAAVLGTVQTKEWRSSMGMEFSEGSKAYFSAHAQAFNNFLSLQNQVQTLEKDLERTLGLNQSAYHNPGQARRKALEASASGWLHHIDQLKDWYNWTVLKKRAIDAGLEPLIHAFEEGRITTDEIISQYNKGIYRSAAEYIIEQHPRLAAFNGVLFKEKIRKFRDISEKFEQLTRAEIYARLAARIPSFTQEGSQSSEIGILQKAIRNNGRGLAIRKIFDAVPNLLPRLKPCMLMSPISVAQYFEADNTRFDLVIFDEASQLPTCEAVGAIARGSSVIVVGDPKQMPPTNFFSSNNVDEENIEQEDLESILDDCLALSMPSQHLLWHYRSKHESLIAFSNAKYYDNKLLTFPSKDDITSKVQFIPVEGHYDKGKTRQNRFEAKAIVDEVVRRLADPLLSARSMGIVTFSSVQQTLIEDLLTEVFSLRPDLEKIALESEEPLFIKNLENVQGDERDIILFSVGYGPDQDGKVGLNFGPINREGGWRRLNVAVSRARYEMKIFSTLRSDQINLNRTGSEGVAGLKAFLAYAEKGRHTLPVPVLQKAAGTNALENQIAAEIRKHGYEVHTQVGSSTYKIDIAVIDKEDPSNYIVGILTDGRNYYNAATSRDREIVQVDVLNMLGWNIHKIWLTEWWENRDKVIAGLLDAIKDATEQQKKAALQPVPAPLPATTQENTQDMPLASPYIPEPAAPSRHAPSVTNAVPYEVCYLDTVTTISGDDFLMPQHKVKIKTQIFNVMEAEAPISKNLLYKRILNAWGISRMGARVNNHLDALLEQLGMTVAGNGKNVFFWKKNQRPDEYRIYRTAGTEAEKRSAEDLPPEEVANAVHEVLGNQISLSQADLVRETAKRFGYARAGANVESSMMEGIRMCINRNLAKHEDGRITII